MPTMSKSQTITDAEWLPNPHAGELLVSEFMEPLGLDVATLSAAIDVAPARLDQMISGGARVDGELDLRLARYFRMSDGFFLRLQDQYELREAKRVFRDDLDSIVPHAA